MKPPMLHTAYIQTMSRNAYGDYTYSSEGAVKCHFREINELSTGTNNIQIQSDAFAWFEPDSGIVKDSIIRFGDDYYRVERITHARRLRSSSVQFIKCTLLRYRTIS